MKNANVSTRIPLVNLQRQYWKIRAEVEGAIKEVLESCQYINGPPLKRFEQEFSRMVQSDYGVACSSGTAALSVSLEALGIKKGDEVVTSCNTFFATAESICAVGARPVFVDIDPRSYTLDPSLVLEAITPRTRALLPVHIYGTPCDMSALTEIKGKYGLLLIEDCAQAHLATYGGKPVGTFGEAAAFSFYPGKNLGAYGDAGFLVLQDARVAGRARLLVDHGRESKYEHIAVGYNHRMDTLQAAMLLVKLKYLEQWTEARRANALRYDRHLRAAGFKVLDPLQGSNTVYHLYVVEVENRSEVMKTLSECGIACGVHYPIPLHLQPAMADLGYEKGKFPVAERVAARVISLPMCAEINEEEIDRVCEKFLEVARP